MSASRSLTWMFCSTTHSRALGVEDVGRVDDRWRRTGRGIPGGQGPADLAGAHRIDQGPVTAQQVEDRQVRTGFLGITDMVERLQVLHPLDDLGGVIHKSGGTKLPGQIHHRNPGNLGTHVRKQRHCRHRTSSTENPTREQTSRIVPRAASCPEENATIAKVRVPPPAWRRPKETPRSSNANVFSQSPRSGRACPAFVVSPPPSRNAPGPQPGCGPGRFVVQRLA